MIVMGGIVGSGIFVTPHVVALHVRTPALIVGAWLAGGAVALAGALVYAELADRRPGVGGQYAYLRDAFHPSVAFVYGWALLLVTQSGGMAAVAVSSRGTPANSPACRSPKPSWRRSSSGRTDSRRRPRLLRA